MGKAHFGKSWMKELRDQKKMQAKVQEIVKTAERPEEKINTTDKERKPETL